MRIFSRTKSRIRQEPSVQYCWFTSAKLWVLVAKSGDENYTVVISFNPWQAHIHFDPIGPVCGGAILDEETILTSVFCVVRPFSNPPQVGFFLWNWLIHLTHFSSADFSWDNSRVVLLRQLWIVNYSIKILSNNLSNENINIGVFLVFKAKHD